MSDGMRIGRLARETGCQVATIRYYEKERLLPDPARSDGNYRLYGDPQVQRLRFIRHCRSLDMSLQEVRALLRLRDTPEEKCGEVNDLLDRHIEHVANRIAELKGLEKELKELRGLCTIARATKDCRVLRSLSGGGGGPKPLGTHRPSRR